ncbi:MAG: tetratricopeptide repeat protein, partial [bacterium]|nr:tetratricopeptide repeat protein [bacterium]
MMKKISLEYILLIGLFIFLTAIAGTINYRRVVNYLFGDEAVYYMMAQSFAGDLDLEYSRKDLMRVYNDGWHAGPQGVFLTKLEDGKIYYAKSFAYSLLLAPFLAVFGMNGFLLLNMLMLFLMILMGWVYLRQFNPPLLSLLVTMTFFILSASFVYSFWLTPEVFNMFCITLGLFLWLYQREHRQLSAKSNVRAFAPIMWLRWLLLTPQGQIYLAPIPIAVAGASKLPNILFVFPILADLLLETFLHIRKSAATVSRGKSFFRHWLKVRKVVWVSLIFAAALLLFYGLQYLFIGHFNQYAGDRKSFYGEFPLESGKDVWEQGVRSSNDDYFEQAFYYRSKVLLHNIYYYLFGRFTGLLPYFCCSFMALYYFLRTRGAWRSSTASAQKSAILPGELYRRLFLLVTLGTSILAYIVLAPSNYQGGGGAFGNRFFVNIYPGFFFLMTSLSGMWPLMVSWIVGSFFLAQILINPFQYSSYPALQAFRFPYRLLPVELTLLNTLPTNLSRSLVQGEAPDRDPTHKLYFFDENAADRSPHEFWVRGRSRADLAIRAFEPGAYLSVTLINGPLGNSVDVTVGGITQTVRFEREREERRLLFPLRDPLPFFRSSVYPVSIRSHGGFVPKFAAGTGLNDSRFLGCRVELSLDAFEAGKTLLAQHRFKKALAEFEKTLEKNPQHIYAHYYLGNSYQALGRSEDALRSFEKSRELLHKFQRYFQQYCRQSNEQCPPFESSPKKISSPQNAELAELLAPLRLKFEAEELSRNTGHVVADSQASGGKFVTFRATEDARGFLAYGRNIMLPAGEYQARYRVKVTPVAGTAKPYPELAFWYDVYSSKKQGILQKDAVSLSPAQLCGAEDFRDYVLNFELA